jgi:hypothetical protein
MSGSKRAECSCRTEKLRELAVRFGEKKAGA